MTSLHTFVSIHDLIPMNNLPVHLLTARSRMIEPEWLPQWHSDPLWRIYHNHTSGATIETPTGRQIAMRPGRIIVIPAWFRFRGLVTQAFGHTWISATTPSWSAAASRRTFHDIVVIEAGHHLFGIFQDVVRAVEAHDNDLTLHQSCQLIAVVHLAVAECLATSPDQEPPSAPGLAALLDHIDANLGGDLRLTALAHHAGLSDGHLSRLASRHLGQSLSSYVRERRAAAAAIRLAQDNVSIEQIANDLGFADRYHFSRVFSSVMGQSPAAYRRQVSEPVGR